MQLGLASSLVHALSCSAARPSEAQPVQKIPDIAESFERAADANNPSQGDSGITQPDNQSKEPENPTRSFEPKPIDPDKDRER
jgi:hypothetical protein